MTREETNQFRKDERQNDVIHQFKKEQHKIALLTLKKEIKVILLYYGNADVAVLTNKIMRAVRKRLK